MNEIAQWLAVIVAAACIARLLVLRRRDLARRRREIDAFSRYSQETQVAFVTLAGMVLDDHDFINSCLKLWIEQRRARLRDEIIQYKDEEQAHAKLAALKAVEEHLLD